MNEKLWLFKSHFDESDLEAVKAVLERGTFWIKGPEIEEFEQTAARYVGRKYGVSFNSGTSALFAVLLAYGISDGEVIVPSFTFPATANAVVAAGAKPVFADIEEQSLALDPENVKRKLTKNTRAIMPIHFAGDVCSGILELKNLAKEWGILLIEDAAHSLGASLKSKQVGNFGDAAMFSFCFNKVISTGEGGMIVTDSEDLNRCLRLICSHGRSEDGRKEYVTYGFNFRMSSMTAALGLSQFARLDWIIARRREMAAYLNEKLSGLEEVALPTKLPGHRSVYQLYNLRLADEKTRDALKEFLSSKGVPTRITYHPVHLTPYYRQEHGWKPGDLPTTESMSMQILTLPFYPDLGEEQLDYIADSVKEFFQG